MDVYKIERNGEVVYVGSTTRDWQTRWMEHRCCLRRGDHRNSHMQSSWDKWGEEAFTCHLIESVEDDTERLVEREQYWMNTLNTQANGYNQKDAGDVGSHSEETCEKISKALTGIKRSAATRKRMSEARKGRTTSEETRKKLSAALKGREINERTREAARQLCLSRVGEKNPCWGRKQPAEERAKRSESMKRWVEEVGFSEEHKQKISESLMGHEVSEEARVKISDKLSGRELSDEHRKNIAAGMKGRVVSEATREKIRQKAKERWAKKRAENAAKAESTDPALEEKS